MILSMHADLISAVSNTGWYTNINLINAVCMRGPNFIFTAPADVLQSCSCFLHSFTGCRRFCENLLNPMTSFEIPIDNIASGSERYTEIMLDLVDDSSHFTSQMLFFFKYTESSNLKNMDIWTSRIHWELKNQENTKQKSEEHFTGCTAVM